MKVHLYTRDPTRQYQDTGKGKWLGKSITITKSKTDYSSIRGSHPDEAINQEYIDAGASLDRWRSLCFAVHDGVPCRRPVTWREGSEYCNKGRGDE